MYLYSVIYVHIHNLYRINIIILNRSGWLGCISKSFEASALSLRLPSALSPRRPAAAVDLHQVRRPMHRGSARRTGLGAAARRSGHDTAAPASRSGGLEVGARRGGPAFAFRRRGGRGTGRQPRQRVPAARRPGHSTAWRLRHSRVQVQRRRGWIWRRCGEIRRLPRPWQRGGQGTAPAAWRAGCGGELAAAAGGVAVSDGPNTVRQRRARRRGAAAVCRAARGGDAVVMRALAPPTRLAATQADTSGAADNELRFPAVSHGGGPSSGGACLPGLDPVLARPNPALAMADPCRGQWLPVARSLRRATPRAEHEFAERRLLQDCWTAALAGDRFARGGVGAVSYTHLTLPTILRV